VKTGRNFNIIYYIRKRVIVNELLYYIFPKIFGFAVLFEKSNYLNFLQIGIGDNIDASQLELIATRPTSHHMINISDMNSLLRTKNKLISQICKSIFPCELLIFRRIT